MNWAANRIGLGSFILFGLINAASQAAPEEIAMGALDGYPACQSVVMRRECRVGSFSSPRGLRVLRSTQISPLIRSQKSFDIHYKKNGTKISIDEYFTTQKSTGLLIIKNGKVLFEKYQYDRQPAMPMRSFSMSKTIVALLIAVAQDRGFIHSLDDPASKYYKAISGTAYGDTTIRNLLRMSSGVKFTEDYSLDSMSDLVRMYQLMNDKSKGSAGSAEAFRLFNVREAEQGSRFNYASIETAVLTRVLTHAVKRPVAELTQEWLWNPIGAEEDAYWLVSPADGVENGGGGFYATLRDWGRVGLLLANDGVAGGKQIIPRSFLFQATDQQLFEDAFKPRRATPYFGYGYQIWVFPSAERSFAMLGLYGQSVFVQPSSGIVMVEMGVYDQPVGGKGWNEKLLMWQGVLMSLKQN